MEGAEFQDQAVPLSGKPGAREGQILAHDGKRSIIQECPPSRMPDFADHQEAGCLALGFHGKIAIGSINHRGPVARRTWNIHASLPSSLNVRHVLVMAEVEWLIS